jgi:hypothetical protein
MKNPKPDPAQLIAEFTKIIADVCNLDTQLVGGRAYDAVMGWPTLRAKELDTITIDEMAKISSRIEKHLEQRCHDVSEPFVTE